MATANTQTKGESSAVMDRQLRSSLESSAAQLDELGTVLKCIATGEPLPSQPLPFTIPAGMSTERLANNITTRTAELVGIARALHPQIWQIVRRGSGYSALGTVSP